MSDDEYVIPDDTWERVFKSEDYQRFVNNSVKHCRCCASCSNPPCDGVLAGGVCDQAQCHCDDEPEPFDDEDDNG